MRSKDSLLRLHRFRCDEQRRQVSDIEMMMADFRRKQDDLELQIKAEEERTGVNDPKHYNYSMTAKSLLTRRENLLKSIDELDEQLVQAQARLVAEEAELRKVELLAEKEGLVLPGTADGEDVPAGLTAPS